MHFATWQNQRSHVVSQGNQRFLYQTQAAPTGGTPAQDDDDGLGALPDGKLNCLLKSEIMNLFFEKRNH